MEWSWSSWLKDWWRLKQKKRRPHGNAGIGNGSVDGDNDGDDDFIDEEIDSNIDGDDMCCCEECINVIITFFFCSFKFYSFYLDFFASFCRRLRLIFSSKKTCVFNLSIADVLWRQRLMNNNVV